LSVDHLSSIKYLSTMKHESDPASTPTRSSYLQYSATQGEPHGRIPPVSHLSLIDALAYQYEEQGDRPLYSFSGALAAGMQATVDQKSLREIVEDALKVIADEEDETEQDDEDSILRGNAAFRGHLMPPRQ
jgi:hypothetical protein